MGASSLLWVLLIGVVLLFYFTRMNGAKGVKSLNSHEFQHELDQNPNKILIDVRTPTEYKSGHIPSAINIPVSDLDRRIDEIDKQRTVFIYCQSGMRSTQAGRILSKRGFQNLVNLRGGIMSWRGKVKG